MWRGVNPLSTNAIDSPWFLQISSLTQVTWARTVSRLSNDDTGWKCIKFLNTVPLHWISYSQVFVSRWDDRPLVPQSIGHGAWLPAARTGPDHFSITSVRGVPSVFSSPGNGSSVVPEAENVFSLWLLKRLSVHRECQTYGEFRAASLLDVHWDLLGVEVGLGLVRQGLLHLDREPHRLDGLGPAGPRHVPGQRTGNLGPLAM